MVTSLRAVGELQNPAIRDRHWLQLMQATQVNNIVVCKECFCCKQQLGNRLTVTYYYVPDCLLWKELKS